MKRKQDGFGAVEGLLVLIVVGLVGFVGWYVYHTRSSTDSNYNNVANSSANEALNSVVANKNSGSKTYADSKWHFKFTYPDGWSLSTRDFVNGGHNTREVILKTSNYRSNTDSVIEDITSGAQIAIVASDTDQTDFSATGLKESEAYKETSIAGVNAVYYIGKGRAFSYSLIKNKVMYNLSLRTVVEPASESKYMPVFEEIVKSLVIKD
jgi:Tfp pilus assembly protein PilV